MFNYLAFLYSGIDKPGEGPRDDGTALANQCLKKLGEIDNPEQFPPKLLILLVSASYLDDGNCLDEIKARQLIAGIHQAFSEAGHQNIPLIGCSVAAVFFDNKIYPDGALLVCLASRLIDVKVAVGPKVSADSEGAVKTLLSGLDIEHLLDEYPKTLPSRALLTFFPDPGEAGVTAAHSPDKLHDLLLKKLTYKIPIVGGVSVANDSLHRKRALQFVDRQPFTDALAACLIRSGVPLGAMLARGLEPLKNATHPILHVKRLSEDKRTIEEFYEGTPEEVLKDISRPILFKALSLDSDFVRAQYLPDSPRGAVKVLREVREHAALEVSTPAPKKMFDETKRSCAWSMQRAGIETPVGSFSIKCAGPYRYSDVLHINIADGITGLGTLLKNSPYVGGFFDGEAGTVESGGSEYGNWGVAAMVFGDEISERAAVQGGFVSLAKHGLRLTGTFGLEEALEQSVELIYDLGFPGAMISIQMPDQEKKRLVPMKAKGLRFTKLCESMRKSGNEDHIPDNIELDKTPLFIRDCRVAPDPTEDALSEAALVSQYVLPLFDPENKVSAILRVDLGDARSRSEIQPTVGRVLEPIAAIVGAAINRIFNWEESKIARELDKALIASLSADNLRHALQRFLEAVLSTFEMGMGHIRLFNADENRLKLEAGAGKYYKAAKEHRSNPDSGDWSPSWDAFVENKIMIINDARNNSSHKVIREKYSDIPQMKETLEGVASYANVPFENEFGAIGTISLVSGEKWFFQEYHEPALAALGQRASTLVDYFMRKEREALAHQQTKDLGKQLKFLQDVSPKLHRISGFDDIDMVLSEATKNFSEGVKAECASLYVWDEGREQYVLRAASGWRLRGWTNAARYDKDSQWIGNRLVNSRPIYIPDLYQYYQEKKYPEGWGRYAIAMFGQVVSKDFSVEALAVPLRVSGDRLGALTLYRRINPGWNEKASGFEITDVDLLQEGANHIAGLVKLLLSHQIIRFDQLAQDRHNDIYTVLTRKDDAAKFDRIVCEKLLNAFKACQVDFYKLDVPDSPSSIFGACGFRRISPEGGVEETTLESPDPTIDTVAERKLLKAIPRRLTAEQRKDPKQAATEGFLERACIPLLAAGSLVGVLDVRWPEHTCMDASLLGSRGEKHLTEIGQMIGSAYWRRSLTLQQEQAKQEAEQSRLAVQAVGAMVFQTAHRLTNLVQKIYRLSVEAREAEEEQSRNDCLDRLSKVVREAMEKINWPMDMARRIQQIARERCCLRDLIDQSLRDAEESEFLIHKLVLVQDDIFVVVNPEHSKEAFLNLINNAIRSMNEKNGGVLTIRGSITTDEKKARIVIEDTGIGMTEEEIQNARRGFVTRENHTGVGVLISLVLLHVQGGTLTFKSTKGVGTKAMITLPLTNGGTSNETAGIDRRRRQGSIGRH